ncbi:uncharacterized protein LOC141899401 isoform X2 [Tubulanus polymorphus]|uniref:uncharacterized protein LOC141899401 isoform X2 n=1 Tax=Tubulanus polymorphus TaxID=672921 RepID=UPI003DA1F3C0
MNSSKARGKDHRRMNQQGPGRITRPPRSNIESKQVVVEGVYSNYRYNHITTSLIGSTVQIQVRNGSIYEGVLKCFSSKMEIVLELAHRLDENNGNQLTSKDCLIEKIIFEPSNIVTMAAINVDLDYANRDAFTDTGISKFNGQVAPKELQRWESDNDNADLCGWDEGGANGWDAADMFRTNAEKYNVKSTYDSSLNEYTTPLNIKDTVEFREKQVKAEQLAREIENSDTYKQSIELENGDEEDRFSAVIRTTESNSVGGNNGASRYVPPHQRKNTQQGRATNRQTNVTSAPNTTTTTTTSNTTTSTTSTNQQQQQPALPEQPQQQQQNTVNNTTNTAPVAPPQDDQQKQKSPAAETAQVPENHKQTVTGAPVESGAPVSVPAVPAQTGAGDSTNKQSETVQNTTDQTQPATTTNNNNVDNVKVASPVVKSRDRELKELKEFSSNFKLSENDKDKKEKTSTTSTTPVEKTSQDKPSSPAESKTSETVLKSTLNPNAKEFVFNPNAKPFQPKQGPTQPVPQTPTPPRPQTQSPVMNPQNIPAMHGHQHQIYPQFIMPPHVSMAQTMVQATQASQPVRLPPKRVSVSVQQPEYNPSAQAVAATGTPLLAQPIHSQHPQYPVQYQLPPVMGPTGQLQQNHVAYQQAAHHQVLSVGNPPRMVNPQMMAGQPPQGMGNHQHQPGTVFVGPGIPGQMPHGIQNPNHQPGQPHVHPPYAPHHSRATPPQSQASHPAPSPAHQGVPPQQHVHHPPTSVTPTQMIYNPQHQQINPQPSHPPLQPSPHTPTSPQANMPVPYTYQAQQQIQQTPGAPQHHMSLAPMHHHATVTYANPQQQSQPPQNPAVVYMHHASQPNHSTMHPPTQLQHAGHHQMPAQAHMGPGHPMSQQAMSAVNLQTGAHPQMHYQTHPPMHTQSHPPVQAFQHSQ